MRWRLLLMSLGLAGVLALGGCGGGDNDDDDDGGNDNNPPPVQESAFSPFVKDALDNPATSEPVSVNDRRFTDAGSGEPDAFNDVLQ